MPAAPRFGDEEDYFAYAGAVVPPPAESALREIEYEGTTVAVLDSGKYQLVDHDVIGDRSLCRLAQNQRILLADHLTWSYLVEQKTLEGATSIRLRVRRGRPISDPAPILALLGGDDD
jgi:hypothetical protein